MKWIVCNIGWMEFYQGQSELDQIKGGGAYVDVHGRGHEVCNFLAVDGHVYGYVQPPGAKPEQGQGTINIDRFDAKGKASVDDILVIWTARQPGGNTVVVGWYKHATLYRNFQPFTRSMPVHERNGLHGYWIRARETDVHLLPLDERRRLPVPRRVQGGMGQSNIWYADTPQARANIQPVLDVIGGKRLSPGVTTVKTVDPWHNAQVELAAVARVQQYYEALNYSVTSVEKDNCGWDLEISAESVLLRVEVKGLSGGEALVQLTANEYQAFQAQAQDYRLAIVTQALETPVLHICRFSQERNGWIIEGDSHKKLTIEEKVSARIRL
jgi:hypothetical protein